MGRKKKTICAEVQNGLRALAFGDVKDAVLLLFAGEDEISKRLDELNLYNVSEIKRPKGGGMEIKFFDRIKALEKLRETDAASGGEPLGFYRALEAGARGAKAVLEEAENE
ncbi:MAG: hypothetical protein LUH82_05090 [Clostridiales bacterium]|nr:hypothetical protein [Clostridiales bacterium]